MIQNTIKSFHKDYLRLVVAVSNTILAAGMFFNPMPHNFFFWFTFGFRVLSVPIAILVGNRGLWVLYFIFCNAKAFDPSYNNLIVIGIISVLFALLPKVNRYHVIMASVVYVTDVFIIAELYNRSGFYIYSTLLLCLQYVTAMWKQKNMNKDTVKTLILTEEELNILEQIEKGEPIKNIDGSSEATVYRRLTEARIRNGIKNNEELKSIFTSRTC